MIRSLMALALRQRIIVLGLAAMLLMAGIYSFFELDIEAYPDPVQPRVEVITQPLGFGAEEVEKLVTVPLEFGLSGMRNLESMRSISLFGLSDIKLYFSWDSDYEFDRVQTINQLSLITLPQGFSAAISPENPIGEIYRYTIEGPNHDLLREKEMEDWILEKQLKTVPGVIDVSGFGGLTKQYQVNVDPQRLNYYAITLSQLIGALRNSNTNAGGNYMTVGEQAFDVRGLGLLRGDRDIAKVVLNAVKSTPVTVSNVADVEIGYAPRLGIVGKDHQDEVVEGIVLMRKYGNTLKTLKGVAAKVQDLNTSGILPSGYKAAPFYDRSDLVDTTLHTVTENLLIGMALVFLVLIFFLGNLRMAIIAALNVPLALCGAFTMMHLGDTPANLISLGAIDFGIIIDSTVIVMENIHRHLVFRDRRFETGRGTLLRASQEVGGPMLFSTLIFVIAFLPLFTMRGVEGAIFSPMSHTYAYALGTAIVLAVTLSPVLSSYLLSGGVRETHNPVWESFRRFYHGLFVRALARPRTALSLIGALIVGVLATFPLLGGEFLPKLEEGNIWARATMPLTISLQQSAKLTNQIRGIFLQFPEVVTVVSQLGRPDDGTDATGFFNSEFYVELEPRDRWPRGLSKAQLVREMDERLARKFPGINFGYSQNIEDNVDEALSGVKGSNSVKVFGPELDEDEHLANDIMKILDSVPGMVDTAVYRSLGQPNLLIAPDRKEAARYGLNVGDVTEVVQAAIGGQAITQVLEGDRRFDLVVRWKPNYREGLDAIRRIRVNTPAGGQVPLDQVARIQTAQGASFIYRENLGRYVPIRFAVRGRDLQSAVVEAKRRVAAEVKLPEGVHLEWSGEYGELQAANQRLMIVVPFALLLIAGILYSATQSLIDTFIIMAQIPVACLGGILALIVTGTPFSVSAGVGFISIFGIAVMDGILLSFYIRNLWDEGHPFLEGIILGSDRRFRAVIMTAMVDGIGLLPAAISTKIGAQTQRPLAIVVIGGAVAIMLLTRILQPVLIYLCHRNLRLQEA